MHLSGGNVHDNTEASACLADVLTEGTVLLADKAYGSKAVREQIEQAGAAYCIPPKSNAKEPWSYDKDQYKERHLVECFFEKLKQYRAIATRYAKLAKRYLAFVHLACIRIWLS